MDIEYLLFLQELREGPLAWLAPAASWITKFAVSCWPLLIVCFLYWVFDRKGGKKLLLGFGLGMLMNGLLKLVFCVYRPWIRDVRVEPYGDSKVAATGYSFPSGHSTFATALLGGTGFWFRKKSWIVTALFWVVTAFVLFSRNFLGVHTPQDVVVGTLATILMMFIACRVEEWTDKNPRRDIYVMIGGIVLCAALVIFYFTKSYPLTYLEDGSLLVDPAKMKADSFEGIGFIVGYVICRFFERRYFRFDEELSRKVRAIIAVFCCPPLLWWEDHAVTIFTELVNRDFAKFIFFFLTTIYVLILVPAIMALVARIMKKKQGTAN